MKKQTYIEVYNAIDDFSRKLREEEQDLLDQLESSETVINGFYVEKLAKVHKKAKEMEALLERYEQEEGDSYDDGNA